MPKTEGLPPQTALARRAIFTLATANLFLFMGAGAQQQYLASYLNRITNWNGLTRASIIAAIYLSMLVFRLGNVWLLRRWPDRRQTLVGSITYTGFCVVMALFFLYPRYGIAMGAALLWGWGGAALWAGSSLQVLAATERRHRHGTGIGLLYTTTHLGFWLGVIVLGQVYERLPEQSLGALYLWAAAVTLVGNLILLMTPRLPGVKPEPPSLADLLSMLAKAKAQIAGFLQFASALTFGIMLGVLGDLVQAQFGADMLWIVAHWYPAARLAWSLASGVLTDRLGHTPVLVGAFLFTTASLLACAGWPTPTTLAIAAASFGLLGAAVPVVASALVGDSAAPERRPLAYGAIFAFRDAGVVIAAMVGQVLLSHLGDFRSLFLTFAGVFALCGVVAITLQRWAQQRL
ncbi:MAG: MFS transporter [Candidatus Zipacnadales bacterium]